MSRLQHRNIAGAISNVGFDEVLNTEGYSRYSRVLVSAMHCVLVFIFYHSAYAGTFG